MLTDWESNLRRDFPEWMDGKIALEFFVPPDPDTGGPIVPAFENQQVYETRTLPDGSTRTGFYQWYNRPQLEYAIEGKRMKDDARAFVLPKTPTQPVMPGILGGSMG